MPNRVIVKFELYLLSLWLLFVLVIVVTIDVPVCIGQGCAFVGWSLLLNQNIVPLVASGLVVAGGVFYWRFDYQLSGSKSIPVSVSSVSNLDYEHLTFLTTYIIPLISFNLSSYRYLFALLTLLIVIGVIYIRTDMFYANPTLAVLGFRLYSARVNKRTGEVVEGVLILRSELSEGDQIEYLQLDDRVYFARRVSKNGSVKGGN